MYTRLYDVNQQVSFFKDLQNQLEEFPHENIIIGGDLYCALTQCDKKGGNPTTRKLSVINEINKLCELYDLTDSWRSVNPNVFQFTWRDKGYVPFTWENRKFQLENQMVRAIPLGKL